MLGKLYKPKDYVLKAFIGKRNFSIVNLALQGFQKRNEEVEEKRTGRVLKKVKS